jgi:hypothetical protein
MEYHKPIIVGDKNVFAIELGRDNNSELDKFCIFLSNEKLGYYDDVVYLSYLKSTLDKILTQDLIIPAFDQLTENEIFQNIFWQKEDYYKCIFSFGESFDDFLICGYRRADKYIFLWKFVDKPFFKYKHFDKKLHVSEIPVNYFVDVYLQFLEFYKIWQITKIK